MRILLIDDKPDERLIVRDALREGIAGVQVVEVGDGSSLSAALEADAIEAVITDYRLGWTDGLRVLRAVKARLPAVPVVMYTGSGSEEIAVSAMKAGAEDYLTKSRAHLARLAPVVVRAVERAATRRRLAEVEGDLHTLAETLDVGIFEAGVGGELRSCNGAFLRLLACDSIDAARSLGLRALLHGVELRREGAVRVRRERRVKRGDGKRVWLVVRLCLQMRGGEKVVQGIIQDVTSRKALEAALREADQRKDEFLAMLAHELRNPLAAIRSGAAIMAGEEATPDMRRSAGGIVERQVRHLARLVDDLLDVARITRGIIELHRQRVQLAVLVKRAVEIAQPVCAPRGQAIRLSLPRHGIQVHADAVRLTQAISNVLQNASKYSPDGNPIDVELDCRDGTAYLSVRDYGRGIAPEELPYLFDLFWQSAQTPDRPRGGLGIGLTLAQRVVQLHGGEIEASSPGLGAGSVFTIALPAAGVRVAVEDETDAGATAGPPRKVLVVEDERDIAEAMSMLLQVHGHDTRVAYDGVAAVEAAREFAPDVALVDIGLPGQDGYAVARALRRLETGRRLQVYALTGYGDEKTVGRAVDAGFDGHLTKPVAEKVLLELLEGSVTE